MHRFFSSCPDLHKDILLLTDRKEVHHICHVLRMKKGQEICVFNGSGEEALGTIQSIAAMKVLVLVHSHRKQSNPSGPVIVLACAIPKKAKFESIIEKCTEIGVDKIIPMKTKRTEVEYDEAKACRKITRFQTVAINAAKQCNRMTIPTISPVMTFVQSLAIINAKTLAFIPTLDGSRKKIMDVLVKQKLPQQIMAFIGPEGDFTFNEVSLARQRGCIPVHLGDNVLKVDTAAITVVTLIKFLCQNY